MQMHPLMQQRRDVLSVLLIRTRAAREEFARRAGLVMPNKDVRFQVKTVGKAYHIVDLSTGKTKAFRWTYQAALDMAIQFEEKANRPAGGQQ
jgi:hypothetical protein